MACSPTGGSLASEHDDKLHTEDMLPFAILLTLNPYSSPCEKELVLLSRRDLGLTLAMPMGRNLSLM